MERFLTEKNSALPFTISKTERRLLEEARFPGITPESSAIGLLRGEIPRAAAILDYNRAKKDAWLAFIGGTGTGKSTLFNALCDQSISETGVERPKTGGPVAYAHEDCPIAEGFPLEVEIVRAPFWNLPHPVAGRPGCLLILGHRSEEWRHLVFVDTPDLDSVEPENRRVTEDLLRLSDAVVFVSSEEKYADEVPSVVLGGVLKTAKPCFFVLNKALEHDSKTDVLQTLQGFGVVVPEEETWIIPYIPSPTPEKLRANPSFNDLKKQILSEMAGGDFQRRREQELVRLSGDLHRDVERMLYLLMQEERVSRTWLTRLDEIHESVSRELTESMKRQYAEESRKYLGEKIRALFARYDVLAAPRKFIREILRAPLRIFGLGRIRTISSRDALARVMEKMEHGPVFRAVEKFHIRVLQELSPHDPSAPLFTALRKQDLAWDEEKIRMSLIKDLEEMEGWLEKTFQDLSRGIPTTTKWGIYTTSILWGILIIALETAVGGGFSILDAAVDSALAPFVTRGAVEFFAAQEIRRIARELGERYQQVLTAPLRERHGRYARCLQSLLSSPEAVAGMEVLHARLGAEACGD